MATLGAVRGGGTGGCRLFATFETVPQGLHQFHHQVVVVGPRAPSPGCRGLRRLLRGDNPVPLEALHQQADGNVLQAAVGHLIKVH